MKLLHAHMIFTEGSGTPTTRPKTGYSVYGLTEGGKKCAIIIFKTVEVICEQFRRAAKIKDV